MATMKVIREQEGIEALFRVLACACDDPSCDAHAIVGSHDPSRKVWAVLGVSGPEDLELALARLLEGDLDEFVGKVCGLVGCPFRRLLDPIQVVLAQEAWTVLPDWMMRFEPAAVWELRGRVFGDDLVRVPAALWALHNAGDPAAGGGYHAAQQEILVADLRYELPPTKGWQG